MHIIFQENLDGILDRIISIEGDRLCAHHLTSQKSAKKVRIVLFGIPPSKMGKMMLYLVIVMSADDTNWPSLVIEHGKMMKGGPLKNTCHLCHNRIGTHEFEVTRHD